MVPLANIVTQGLSSWKWVWDQTILHGYFTTTITLSYRIQCNKATLTFGVLDVCEPQGLEFISTFTSALCTSCNEGQRKEAHWLLLQPNSCKLAFPYLVYLDVDIHEWGKHSLVLCVPQHENLDKSLNGVVGLCLVCFIFLLRFCLVCYLFLLSYFLSALLVSF